MNQITKKVILRLGYSFLTVALAYILSYQNRSLAADIETVSNPLVPDTVDGRTYQKIINRSHDNNLSQAPLGTVIQTVAEQFLGAEYKPGLLDQLPQETLVISLQKFDCLLFVETVLAIARNITQQNYSYQGFINQVENQRYWDGKLNGYCSRLHYFSDWIDDNQRRENVSNITPKLGGVNLIKKLNFMTTHRSSYANLANNNLNFECIARVENSLSTTLNYIPRNNISKIYDQLKPGDIIGIATDISGLDFTHTGFVYRQSNGNLGLIHASPVGKVVIAKDLQIYVENVKNAIGIVVTRANKPKL